VTRPAISAERDRSLRRCQCTRRSPTPGGRLPINRAIHKPKCHRERRRACQTSWCETSIRDQQGGNAFLDTKNTSHRRRPDKSPPGGPRDDAGATLRLQDYAAAVSGRSIGAPSVNARAAALLATAVRTQANVLSIIDGFMVIGFAIIGLLLMLLPRPPPTLSRTP
jgi:hypothetical protein